MTKTQLAGLLGVSISMVSRLAKRGMPTDTLERAQRWRRRHLEPGRMKGARYDPAAIPVNDPLEVVMKLGVAAEADFSAFGALLKQALRELPVALRGRIEFSHELWEKLIGAETLRFLAEHDALSDHPNPSYFGDPIPPEGIDGMTAREMAEADDALHGLASGFYRLTLPNAAAQ